MMKTNEVLETIKARRSVRVHDKKQVPSEDLNAILEVATYASSGMYYETWHFTVVRNVAKLKKLNSRIEEAFARSDDKRLQKRGHSETYCYYYHAPSLVIASNDPTQWQAGMGCACAIENMFLTARSLGVGSCWVNQSGTAYDDPEIRVYFTSLGVPENHKAYGYVVLGYQAEGVSLKEKTTKKGTITIVEQSIGFKFKFTTE